MKKAWNEVRMEEANEGNNSPFIGSSEKVGRTLTVWDGALRHV